MELGKQLFVAGLKEGVTKEDLESAFEKFGELQKVTLTIKPPGNAYIIFLNEDDAEAAYKNMNDYDLKGSKLSVKFSSLASRGDRNSGHGNKQFKDGVEVKSKKMKKSNSMKDQRMGSQNLFVRKVLTLLKKSEVM